MWQITYDSTIRFCVSSALAESIRTAALVAMVAPGARHQSATSWAAPCPVLAPGGRGGALYGGRLGERCGGTPSINT